MSFCNENNKYISLYIDDLLDEKTELLFKEHIKECSECSHKLEEMSLLAELCKEEDEIPLPEKFAASIHDRLISLDTNKAKSKRFVYNKKLIASLSTAAILVISLFAYNLLPEINVKNQSTKAAESVQMESDSNIIGDRASGKSSDTSLYNSSESATANVAGNFADNVAETSDKTDDSNTQNKSEVHVVEQKEDVKIAMSFSKSLAGEYGEDSGAAKEKSNVEVPSVDGQKRQAEPDAQISSIDNEVALTMTTANSYYSNSIELNLNITSKRIEIDVLDKMMEELGSKKLENSDADVIIDEDTIEFIDYELSLVQYSKLESIAAEKYELDLSTKTEITKTDLTDEYNILNMQMIEIDEKITQAIINNESTSELELEKTNILNQINDIIMKKDMISVKIYICR